MALRVSQGPDSAGASYPCPQKLMQPVLDGLAEGEGAVGEGLGENGPYLATLSCEDAVKVGRTCRVRDESEKD